MLPVTIIGPCLLLVGAVPGTGHCHFSQVVAITLAEGCCHMHMPVVAVIGPFWSQSPVAGDAVISFYYCQLLLSVTWRQVPDTWLFSCTELNMRKHFFERKHRKSSRNFSSASWDHWRSAHSHWTIWHCVIWEIIDIVPLNSPISRSCRRRCGVVGSTLAFGSIGHGFESEHSLFSYHSVSAFSKLRSLT